MKYSCPYAHYVDDEIMCKKQNDDFCGNVKFCRMSGRWQLTDLAVNCPKRLEEDKPAKKAKAKEVAK